jgi:hypothetical protein
MGQLGVIECTIGDRGGKHHAAAERHEEAGQLHSGGGVVLRHQGARLLLQSIYNTLFVAVAAVAACCELPSAPKYAVCTGWLGLI